MFFRPSRQCFIFTCLGLGLFVPGFISRAWAAPYPTIDTVEPGWGAWQPPEQLTAAKVDSGFSNLELGGYLDFQYSCGQEQNVPMDDAVIWFRVNDLVAQLGTGEIEYGCVVGNEIRAAMRITAINRNYESVTCWEINPPTQAPLPVYQDWQEPKKMIRQLAHGTRVDPGSYPAWLSTAGSPSPDGIVWAEIQKPVKGWIQFGQLGTPGNFRICPGQA